MIITVSTSLKEMDVEFIRKLVKYLFIPVEIAAMVIVYIYMSKIIVTAKYPSNEIFEIIGTIFAYSFIIWILQGSFKEEKKFFKYTQKYLTIAFIPLWIFQLVSLGMRIVAYSVTTRRYIGIFILIFEMIAILILIIKKQKANNLFIVGMVMMAILTLVPGLNMIDFPNLIQEHIYKSPESKSELYDYKDDSLVIEDDRDLPKYFDYYLTETHVLKFDVDDLFFYSTHTIMHRGGHLFVSDYGMQLNILNRYGIKNFAVPGKDYRFVNGDNSDFRYKNIDIINRYYGVKKQEENGRISYLSKIHINGDFLIGRFRSETDAAIAYNKAVDTLTGNGIQIQYTKNYIDGMSSQTYLDTYEKIRLPKKIRDYNP